MSNYYIVRFEDLVCDPARTIQEVYDHAGLDVTRASRFRLQAKASMTQEGQRQYTFGAYDREVQWFGLDDLSKQFRTDVNENQIARLSPEDKEKFLRYARGSMQHFGYL